MIEKAQKKEDYDAIIDFCNLVVIFSNINIVFLLYALFAIDKELWCFSTHST